VTKSTYRAFSRRLNAAFFLQPLVPFCFHHREAFLVADLARNRGRPGCASGLATAAASQTLHFPAEKCFTALPGRPSTDHSGRVVSTSGSV
jgi:hypothetical protein